MLSDIMQWLELLWLQGYLGALDIPPHSHLLPLLPLHLCLFSCPSAGWWGGAGWSGHHVHPCLSWPRPWVPTVPGRGGGARGRGDRRRQGKGVRQRQCCGKHPGVRHFWQPDQTGGQGRRLSGSWFSWGKVSAVPSSFLYLTFPVWFTVSKSYFSNIWLCFFSAAHISFIHSDRCLVSAALHSMLFLFLIRLYKNWNLSD